MPEKQKILFSWQAPEFDKQEKTFLWDLGIIAFSLCLALWGLWKGDVTLIALAIFAGLSLWLLGKKEPKTITFALRSDGVQAGTLLYRWRALESFWIFHEPPHINELVLRSHHAINPLVHINLDAQDPDKIKKVLQDYLPEKEEPYPISHVLGRMIGY